MNVDVRPHGAGPLGFLFGDPMSRYTASELVPLPRVTATGAVALGAQVLSTADGQKKDKALPKELQKPRAAEGHDPSSATFKKRD